MQEVEPCLEQLPSTHWTPIAMARYVAGLIAAIASGGSSNGHGAPVAATINQYSEIYLLLFEIGVVVGVIYFVLAPMINKLMHGVK